MKNTYALIICLLLSACSAAPKREYAVVEKNDVVKACYYDELDAAKRAATTAFLEEKKINFSANNNSVCNSHGCVQEDELRSYSAANVNISLMRRDVAADCRYFKVTLNKTPNKVNKFVWSNQEGMFDISDESDKHFIQINVINRKGFVSAKMNGKYVILNNNTPILMSGENTLKFVISDPSYETKEFTIHTPKKAHKIIKNITLVPIKRKVEESDLGLGFKHITSRNCYLFCDHKDVLVNDEPFRFDMVKKNQHFMINYYLFNDINLYKTMGIDVESTYDSDENMVVVKAKPFINRGNEFKDAITKITNIGKCQRYFNGHEEILGKNIDNGSAPFLVLHLEISLYDSNGKLVDVSDSALKIYTAQMYPELYWTPSVYTSNFYGVYHKAYKLKYKLYLKYDDIEGHISGVGGKYETLWWWKNIDKHLSNEQVFNRLLKKYAKQIEAEQKKAKQKIPVYKEKTFMGLREKYIRQINAGQKKPEPSKNWLSSKDSSDIERKDAIRDDETYKQFEMVLNCSSQEVMKKTDFKQCMNGFIQDDFDLNIDLKNKKLINALNVAGEKRLFEECSFVFPSDYCTCLTTDFYEGSRKEFWNMVYNNKYGRNSHMSDAAKRCIRKMFPPVYKEKTFMGLREKYIRQINAGQKKPEPSKNWLSSKDSSDIERKDAIHDVETYKQFEMVLNCSSQEVMKKTDFKQCMSGFIPYDFNLHIDDKNEKLLNALNVAGKKRLFEECSFVFPSDYCTCLTTDFYKSYKKEYWDFIYNDETGRNSVMSVTAKMCMVKQQRKDVKQMRKNVEQRRKAAEQRDKDIEQEIKEFERLRALYR